MNLQTKAIVRAIQGILTEAETALADRIFPNRFHPVWEEELPAALVYALEEKTEILDTAPRTYKRTLTVAVTVCVPAKPPPVGNPPRKMSADRLLGEYGQEIEDALAFDQCLLGTCAESYLTGTQVIALKPDKGQELAAGRMTYEVVYHTEAGEGGDVRALFDLTLATLKWGPKTSAGVHEDHVELERPGPS